MTAYTKQSKDQFFMNRALLLAEKGKGFTSPNPVAGACLVKNDKLIGEGFHSAFGENHAEVSVLKRAGAKTKGGTLYVTLEPCSTWGKTAPCVTAIQQSGVKRVVVGAIDPNPKHAGRGISILKRSGIAVETGVMKQEAENQNVGFRHWILTKMPYVILKLAQTLDGKIATYSGDSKWITGQEARVFAHELRSRVDGVMVGKNTVLRDDPRLTVRNVKSKWQPWRFILDLRGELPISHQIFQEGSKTVLVCSARYVKNVVKKFSRKAISVLPAREQNGKINLNHLLSQIGALGITSVLVEGGGEVAAGFLEQKLVHKIYFMIAPKIAGGRNAKTSVEGKGVRLICESSDLKNVNVFKLGADIMIEGNL